MFCPNCGKEVSNGAKFCKYCGTTLEDASDPYARPVNNSANKVDDKPLKGGIIGFVLSFFLGLIGFIICLVLGDDDCRRVAIWTFIISIIAGIIIGIVYWLFIAGTIFAVLN